MSTPDNRPKRGGTPPVSGQFKPGKSGNPGGRPKGASEFGRMIREFMAEPHPRNVKKMRLRVLIEDLARRDHKTLLAYGYGKPVEVHEVQDGNGDPLPALRVEIVGGVLPRAKG